MAMQPEPWSPIFVANTEQVPDTSIPTRKTGMRHRAAERVTKLTGKLVVTVSGRSSVITIYKKGIKLLPAAVDADDPEAAGPFLAIRPRVEAFKV